MKKTILWVVVILIQAMPVAAINVAEYLIEADIGEYSLSYSGACPRGSGVVAGAGHFRMDHVDHACDIRYYNETLDLGVEVRVTQHAGADSDKWLLHELDAEFRNYYGIPGKSYFVRKIDDHTSIAFGSGGWDYRWLSGNKVIVVEYTDLEMRKPEPLEVVKAYLAKHPSTLPAITATIQRSSESITIWVKDEMERRLWLCDKWFLQLQVGKTELLDTLQSTVKHLNVFLDYREKYYGIKARDEKIGLNNYLLNKDGTAIKNKLTEYKTWWSVNKTKSISLP